jgi:hypothetical protein
MTIHFWSNEPAILFNKEYIFELWPTKDMCYEQKMNAITRLIILMTILGYILTSSIKILSVGALTILIIFILFTMRKQKISKKILDEGFKIKDTKIEDTEQYYDNPVTLDSVLKTEFKEGTKKNPFSNVLLTQINDDPERKSAPPSFNVSVSEDITRNIKKTVQMLNPEIKNTDKQLFGDMFQEFELDQSNRQFFSAPNTRVMNDQGAFAKYLYEDLKFSSKESTPEGAIARVQDLFRYNLY